MESQKRPKNPRKLVLEKAFHKNAKTCRAGFHKKTNQTRWDSHDNTFSDYHPYIDLSNHTHHNLPCLHTTHIHTTQHTVATTHSPSQLHLLYTQNTLTHTTNYWSTSTIIPIFSIINQCNCMVILHTTNPYIYKQANPPLQQALVP